MSKLKYLTLAVVLSFFLLPLGFVSAQTDTTPEDPILYDTTYDDTYDYDETYDYDAIDYTWDEDFDYNWDLTEEDTTTGVFGALFATVLATGGMLLAGVGLVITLAISLAFYVYSAITLKKTAEILGYTDTWMAWVPIANSVLMFKMGDMNPWLLLIVLIPGLGALVVMVVALIAMANIAQKRGYDKLLTLINLIPTVGMLVYWGMMAWGNKDKVVAPKA